MHLQHGIGRYQGLGFLPTATGERGPGSTQECLIIEYAARDIGQPPPKLYVPITEAHLVSKYVGAGKARPPLNTLGEPAGRRQRPKPRRRCGIWRRNSSACRPPARRNPASRSPPTLPGNGSSRARFSTRKPRTSCGPSARPSAISRRPSPWTG
ncbi:MAG: hypothetical protein M5U12_24970 [Verrucomicrobia bacterium]|nr:hypothetical protein [Verrucomicrobiota bacterium]